MKERVLDWFNQNYSDLINNMKTTYHEHSNGSKNPYHLENDVWTHTMMVLDLVENDKINHIFAAILHDIGKIDTRYEKSSGRVSFIYHENVSMYKSIDILKEAEKIFNIDILKVLKFIAWHGTLWSKIKMTERLNEINLCYGSNPDFLQELVDFVEADAFGRDFDTDVATDVDIIQEQFDFLRNYIPFDKSQFINSKPKEALFLIGISGSGKSTYINQNKLLDTHKLLSVDKYFDKKKMDYDSVDYKKNIKKAFNESLIDLNNYIQNRDNIVVDMTNLSKEIRRKKLSKIPSTQYNTKAIVFLNGEKNIYNNLSKREGKKLSKEVIEKQLTQFELPNFDEFDEIEFII